MTAHGTPEVTKGALDLGAYEVMHKPSNCTSSSRRDSRPSPQVACEPPALPFSWPLSLLLAG